MFCRTIVLQNNSKCLLLNDTNAILFGFSDEIKTKTKKRTNKLKARQEVKGDLF